VIGRRGDRLTRVDFVFAGTPVVVEALGYRWHRTTVQQNIDSERSNDLLLRGFDPYQFTYEQIVRTPAYVVETVRAALSKHAAVIAMTLPR
jgi:very-short-patch-repair endonuclease